jgi:hypothetical protein
VTQMTKAPPSYLEGVYTDTFINTIWIPLPFGSHMEATRCRFPQSTFTEPLPFVSLGFFNSVCNNKVRRLFENNLSKMWKLRSRMEAFLCVKNV